MMLVIGGLSQIQINLSQVVREALGLQYALNRILYEENNMSCCGSCGGQDTDKADDQDKSKEQDQESSQASEQDKK